MAVAEIARPLAFPHRLGDAVDAGPRAARTKRVAANVRELLTSLGLDLRDPNLSGTPDRVARAYEELLAGLAPDAEPALRTFPNTERYRQMVAVTELPFYSLCAHHFLPFFGEVHVAYLPKDRVVGLSKLGRVVEYYARRPQLQETFTEEIAGLVEKRLRPAGVGVLVRARHLCLEMRGLSKPGVVTTTTSLRGAFGPRQRRELLELVTLGSRQPGASKRRRSI